MSPDPRESSDHRCGCAVVGDVSSRRGVRGEGGKADAAARPDGGGGGSGGRPPPSYVRCDSTEPFEMPPPPAPSEEQAVVDGDGDGKNAAAGRGRRQWRRRLSAAEVNETLNLNLGLPIDPMQPRLRMLFRWLSNFFQLFEERLFALWDRLPLRFRQKLTLLGWRVYYPLHKFLLGRRTAIHPDASHEYHALTTVMWWGRLFPVTIRRMRFSLSQLGVCHPPEAYPPCLKRGGAGAGVEVGVEVGVGEREGRGEGRLLHGGGGEPLSSSSSPSRRGEETKEEGRAELAAAAEVEAEVEAIDPAEATVVSRVRHDMGRSYRLARGILRRGDDDADAADGDVDRADDAVVTGYYVRHGRSPSSRVVLWLYGGAYLAGDSRGNLGIAEKVGQRCRGADVFLPDYRLLPEHEFYDAHFDVVLAYEYLVTVRGVSPENVLLLGVSSGGGLVTRLLQTIAERREELTPEKSGGGGEGKELVADRLLRNPAGGVLMCPFVDYTEPKGSFKEYAAHDLIVNQSVLEEGVPHLASLGSAENRRRQSPAHRSFRGLPPLCVVISEHECCFDQTVLLVNRAREDGVDVTLGVWRYMCHVFPMLSMFLPEGREAIDFMVDWMRGRFA